MNLIDAFLWGFLSMGLGLLLIFVVVVINDFLVDRDLRRRLREEKERRAKE